MRVLVTGAAGFLGSHLTDRLLSEGHTVVGVDNLCTGSRENIAHLSSEPRFCYVGDLIEGILRLARSHEHLPVNIGNPNEFTILECAKAVLGGTGSTSELRFEALPQDDPTRRCPDITKARTLLGWEPQVQFKEGLQKSLDFFRSNIHSQV